MTRLVGLLDTSCTTGPVRISIQEDHHVGPTCETEAAARCTLRCLSRFKSRRMFHGQPLNLQDQRAGSSRRMCTAGAKSGCCSRMCAAETNVRCLLQNVRCWSKGWVAAAACTQLEQCRRRPQMRIRLPCLPCFSCLHVPTCLSWEN